jgi:DNA-binding response OmpR family regulator
MLNTKILVIDDEEPVRKTIANALDSDVYDLIFAENGEEGLRLYKEHEPVVVILDLRMPKMDGVTFLEKLQLKQSEASSIIVLTGHGTDDDMEKCFDMGICAFLRKPFNFYEINGLVRHSISIASSKMVLSFYKGINEGVEET